MNDAEKLELLHKIKEYRDLGESWRPLSIKMGKSEKWAYRFWKKNEHLVTSMDTKVGTIEPTSGTKVGTPPEVEAPPIIVKPTPTPQSSKAVSPPRRTPPMKPAFPSYGQFIKWCREHPEHPYTASMIKNCEGSPRKHWRSIVMKTLDLLKDMQEDS